MQAKRSTRITLRAKSAPIRLTIDPDFTLPLAPTPDPGRNTLVTLFK